MKIAAVTNFKQGDIWEALQKLGWSQAELARRTGCTPISISQYVRLISRPSKETIEKIERVFAKAGISIELVYPANFERPGRRSVTQIREVPLGLLLETKKQIEHDPVKALLLKENKERLGVLISEVLTHREGEVIKLRYGLDGYAVYSINEIGRMFKITRQRVDQIIHKAIRKLQYKESRRK